MGARPGFSVPGSAQFARLQQQGANTAVAGLEAPEQLLGGDEQFLRLRLVSLARSRVPAKATRRAGTLSGMLTILPSTSYSPATAPHSRWSHPTTRAARSSPETPVRAGGCGHTVSAPCQYYP